MKYKYKLTELDCANCANSIEEKLIKDKNIINANVNFSKLTLTVETNLENNVTEYVTKIIKSIEPDVNILEISSDIKIKKKEYKDLLRIIIGTLTSVLGIYIFQGNISKILVILGYIILLYRTTKNAIKLLFKSKTINENLLVTISCIGAYFTGNINEGLMVIILYEIGKLLENIAINNSRKSISDLMDIKPEYANLKENNDSQKVNPEEVKVNDIIIIKQGEKVPLDGIVIKGEAKLNTSALTGESKLRKVTMNDKVLSGSVNTSGLIELKVTNHYNDSTVSKILELVESATDRKAKTETFVAKAAKIYTPIVLILAILIALSFPILLNISITESIYRALVFLVISCPCAIAISVPLSYFTGIGKASKEGILIKGSNYLDSLCNINEIIFDKTGTLTTGTFTDYKLEILDKNYTEKEIINLYIQGEKLSNHPIAKSIINIFNQSSKGNIKNFKEISGKGISYELEDNKIKIGSANFCDLSDKSGAIYLKINNKLIAKLELFDGIKKGTKNTIKKLKQLGITSKMYTGDSKEIATKIASQLGITDVSYELLPEDKYKLLEKEIKSNPGKTAFVGDGINDAPSIALADIGISMGGVGSASAIEASDIVIMTDEIDKIVTGIKISKKTNHIIKQNLIFAIGIKILVLILSALGIASMWQAVFADTGVTLITILNTTRILKD